MNDRTVNLMDDLLVLLVDHWLVNLVYHLLVYYGLDVFMNDCLMMLVNDIAVVLMNYWLMMFMNQLTVVLLDYGYLMMLLNARCHDILLDQALRRLFEDLGLHLICNNLAGLFLYDNVFNRLDFFDPLVASAL
jgi:hypothetical protein